MRFRLAYLLSVLLHPLLVPSYLTVVLLRLGPATLFRLPRQAHAMILTVVVGCTLLLPALGTYALVRAGHGSSLMLPEREKRHWPLLLTLAGFLLATGLLWSREPVVGLALGLQAVAVALTWLVTRYWLISAHGVAMGGAVGMVVLLGHLSTNGASASLAPLLAVTVLLAGAVGSARLALAAHTPAQVWAGLALGLGVGLGAILTVE